MFRRKRVSLIVEDEKGILVVKHIFPWTWGLPGGGIKFREDPREAVKRELFEELGLATKRVRFLFTLNCGFHRHIVFLVKPEGTIRKNWEILDCGYYGKVSCNRYVNRIIDTYFADKKHFS